MLRDATDCRIQAEVLTATQLPRRFWTFQLLFQKPGHVHTAIFTMDNQQGPPVRRRGLCAVLHGGPHGWDGTHAHGWPRPCCPPGTLTTLLISRRLCAQAQSRPPACDAVDCSPPGSSSVGFPRQEYRSRLPSPIPLDLPDPGIEPVPPALKADSLPAVPSGKPTNQLSVRFSCSVMSHSLQPHGLQHARLPVHH